MDRTAGRVGVSIMIGGKGGGWAWSRGGGGQVGVIGGGSGRQGVAIPEVTEVIQNHPKGRRRAASADAEVISSEVDFIASHSDDKQWVLQMGM